MKFNNDSDLEKLAATFAKRARDFDDLQNEAAGREVGRMPRFLAAEDVSPRASERKRAERAEALTRLQLLLLNDPAYAALHKETTEKLNEVQNRLAEAMERVLALRARTDAELAEMLKKAARTADGEAVFRDANGDVRTADGRKVDDDMAATAVWHGGEPSFEDYRRNRERDEGLDDLAGDIGAGQAEVGDMQDKGQDQENPATAEELRRRKERAEEIAGGVEERLDREMSMSQPSSDISVKAPESIAGLAFPTR